MNNETTQSSDFKPDNALDVNDPVAVAAELENLTCLLLPLHAQLCEVARTGAVSGPEDARIVRAACYFTMLSMNQMIDANGEFKPVVLPKPTLLPLPRRRFRHKRRG